MRPSISTAPIPSAPPLRAHESPRLDAAAPQFNLRDFPRRGGIEALLGEIEQAILDHATKRCDGNKRAVATMLGISRYALQRRINRLAQLRARMAAAGLVATS